MGTAGWTIPKEFKSQFPEVGSHLERYSQILSAVEINSSFYKSPKPSTYEKWAEATPDHFKFSVKLLRYFTQEKKLIDTGAKLRKEIEGICRLGKKLGVILVQLPPSLQLDFEVTENFFEALREYHSGPIALEPRHPSWATLKALDLLSQYKISKVFADPERAPLAETAQVEARIKAQEFLYLRLHGSPEIYKSKYTKKRINEIAKQMIGAKKPSWCIFDNTTYGYATKNALDLLQKLQ